MELSECPVRGDESLTFYTRSRRGLLQTNIFCRQVATNATKELAAWVQNVRGLPAKHFMPEQQQQRDVVVEFVQTNAKKQNKEKTQQRRDASLTNGRKENKEQTKLDVKTSKQNSVPVVQPQDQTHQRDANKKTAENKQRSKPDVKNTKQNLKNKSKLNQGKLVANEEPSVESTKSASIVSPDGNYDNVGKSDAQKTMEDPQINLPLELDTTSGADVQTNEGENSSKDPKGKDADIDISDQKNMSKNKRRNRKKKTGGK